MKPQLEKPQDHSMAHHLVTYAANNMIAPLVHAQIARDEYEDACDTRDDAVRMLREATELVYTLTGYAESTEKPMLIGATTGEARSFLARYEKARKSF